MYYSKNGYKLTEGFESCKLKAYQDQGGVWTIAWGHTRGVTKGLTCIQLQADAWLVEDIVFSEATVNDLVKVQINQNEFDALVDFVFNVGITSFETSSLLRLLNAGNFAEAAEQFDNWDHVKANGTEIVAAGLLRRREAETADFQKAIDTEGAD